MIKRCGNCAHEKTIDGAHCYNCNKPGNLYQHWVPAKDELIEGCEFCRGDYSLEGIYAEVEIIKGNLKISISDSIVDIDDWIKINYCPMCGKKLVG